MNDIIVMFLTFYFICSQAIYIIHVKKYMNLHNIESMNEQEDNFHQYYGNQFWMSCLLFWWNREKRLNYMLTSIENYNKRNEAKR